MLALRSRDLYVRGRTTVTKRFAPLYRRGAESSAPLHSRECANIKLSHQRGSAHGAVLNL
jgi:hypothetical protein